MVDYQKNCQWIRVGIEYYCDCPPPEIVHSHIVANRCLPIEDGVICRATVGCDYECDVGYVWNGVNCVLPPPPPGKPLGLGNLSLFAVAWTWLKRRRRRRLIGTLIY